MLICKMGRLKNLRGSCLLSGAPLCGQRQAGPRPLPLPAAQVRSAPLPRLLLLLSTASLPPTPRLTLRGSGSSRKSAVSLKTRTGWACGTSANTEGGAIARQLETAEGSHSASGATRSRLALVTGGDSHLHLAGRGGPAASNGLAASGTWQRGEPIASL